jgi:hypothetical protein
MSATPYPRQASPARKTAPCLDLAESAGCEIFVTMDKGLEYEQNLAGRSIAILILRARSNRLADLLPLVPNLLRTVKPARKGEIHRISGGEPAA